MKIAFIGGVQFSHELLLHILNLGWEVSVVFSYDDSKKKYYSDFASFDKITEKFSIFHVKVDKINDEKNIEILQKINPDLILVMGWSQLLSLEIIKIPKLGIIGSHPTELPKYRGRAPIPWSIIKGLKESALTFFYIQEGVDDGDILDQSKFDISDNDDASSIYQKMTKLGKQMLESNLPLIATGKQNHMIQDPSMYIESWPKRVPDDGKIDWSKSAKEIHTLIRATTKPYPGAFTFLKNEKLIIWSASYSNERSLGMGIIMEITLSTLKIGTSKGCLIINKDDFEGIYDNDMKKIFSNIEIGDTFDN